MYRYEAIFFMTAKNTPTHHNQLTSASSGKKTAVTQPSTPYYLIDEAIILDNLKIIKRLCDLSGAKALLALKCFATWGVFDMMKPYLHGTTSSSLNEVRLGKETFANNAQKVTKQATVNQPSSSIIETNHSSTSYKETHAYSVAYSATEIDEVLNYADKIIFNSLNQLQAFKQKAQDKNIPIGLRLNPKSSNSAFLIADPARPFSRLGEHDVDKILPIIDDITGVMIHNNCENDDFEAFSSSLTTIEEKFGTLFHQLDWVSLGGGIHFIAKDYPLEKLAQRLKTFSEVYGVQIYLEPGEACIHQAASLVTTVLDTLHNDKPLAVVDASIEAHMLDLLIYRETAPLVAINSTPCQHTQHESVNSTIIYGKSCLAGDIFGEYLLNTDTPDGSLNIGDRLAFGNAAGYTMVKKNWFNGVDMPSIIIRRLDGSMDIQKRFGYADYKASLS